MSSQQEFSCYFSFATNCAVQPGPVYIRAVFRSEHKPWFSRYRGASFSSNACFLRLAIVWHSMATLEGPNLPTSFASDQLERSHVNVVFFSAIKGVIQELYSEIMKPSGPPTSKQPTTSVLFNGAAGGEFLPREFSHIFLSAASRTYRRVSLACHGPWMSNPIFGFLTQTIQ